MERKELDLIKAEQQILGFNHRNQGFSLEDLLDDMGLEKKEWESILEKYPHYKEKGIYEEIQNYFNNKEESE